MRPLFTRFFLLLGLTLSFAGEARETDYTVLNYSQYQAIVKAARQKIPALLAQLKSQRGESEDSEVAILAKSLADIPYSKSNTIGEGDWQPQSLNYVPGAVHLNQNPVYRLDKMDCQSFTEFALALLTSTTLKQFDRNILKISYGAAGNPQGEIVRFYNRNHFVDGDFNPVNQKNGFLEDVTSYGALSPYAKSTESTLTRNLWFENQLNHLDNTVNVLKAANGKRMAERYRTLYLHLPFPQFESETISLSYLPKHSIALQNEEGGFTPNQALLNKIPTPAIAEIVSDTKEWFLHRQNIKESVGTELNVSHLGLLYRQQFHDGELIYQKIFCDNRDLTRCQVIPIVCQKKLCNELMFVHATKSHPDGYYWYRLNNGQYTCTRQAPKTGVRFTRCNRVERLPLFDYLTEYQNGHYWYMNNPAILGIHVEKITLNHRG